MADTQYPHHTEMTYMYIIFVTIKDTVKLILCDNYKILLFLSFLTQLS